MPLERLVVEVEIAFDNVSNNFELGITGEGNFARQHDVSNNAERPHIDFAVVTLQKNFRRNVVGLKHLVRFSQTYRPTHRLHGPSCGKVFAQAKVNHLYARGVILLEEHEVLWLDVATKRESVRRD